MNAGDDRRQIVVPANSSWTASSDHEPVFYITASPKNRDWSAAEPDRTVDMSSFSQIVFIGQFIQPHRFLTSAAPLSNSPLQTIFEKYPLYIPVNPHDPHLAYNEPLELFHNLTDCRIFSGAGAAAHACRL
jgi:hypothetical protein